MNRRKFLSSVAALACVAVAPPIVTEAVAAQAVKTYEWKQRTFTVVVRLSPDATPEDRIAFHKMALDIEKRREPGS